MPGAARAGSGGRIGDAIVFALGASFAGGWALVAAAGLSQFMLEGGAATLGP